MVKNKKTIKKLVDELEKSGNVTVACSKADISYATYYRWRKEDREFVALTDEAVQIGRENMTGFTESKLIKNISDGHERAIEFYLKHNDQRYKDVNRLKLRLTPSGTIAPIALV